MHSTVAPFKIVYLTGSILTGTIAMVLLLASLTFLLGGTVAKWHFPLSFILTALLWYFTGARSLPNSTFIRSLLLCMLIIIVSILLAVQLYDVSYDGQTYHMEGIYQLRHGWNPTKTLLPNNMNLSVFINHYSKGVELPQSTIYSLLNRIEAAKATNFILFAASLCLALSFFLETGKLSVSKCVVISLLLALNPVAVNQLISTCVDGQMATMLLCLFITMLLFVNRPDSQRLFLLGAIIIITANIKFTGLVYVIIFISAFLAWLLYTRKKVMFNNLLLTFLFSGTIATVLVGFNPYVVNTIKFGHPFYPLMGPNAVNIMDTNTPNEFQGKNTVTKFFYSFFSHTDNMVPGKDSKKVQLKIPFALNKSDIMSAGKIDSRIAGFGPFFSGITIVSAALLIFLLIRHRKATVIKNAVYLIAVIVLSVCIIPESWWARYIPQLWYIPLIVLVCVELYYPGSLKLSKMVLYGAFIANIGLVFIGLGWNLMMSTLINYQIKQLKSSNQPVAVKWGVFNSNRIRFQENNIPFVEKDITKEKNITGITRSNAIFIMPASGYHIPKSKIVQWAEKFQ